MILEHFWRGGCRRAFARQGGWQRKAEKIPQRLDGF